MLKIINYQTTANQNYNVRPLPTPVRMVIINKQTNKQNSNVEKVVEQLEPLNFLFENIYGSILGIYSFYLWGC